MRMRSDQRVQLADQRRVPSEREIRLDAILHRRHAQLGQPRDLAGCKRRTRELRHHLATPQPQRGLKRPCRLRRVAVRQRLSPGRNQPLERVGIHLPRAHAQPDCRDGDEHVVPVVAGECARRRRETPIWSAARPTLAAGLLPDLVEQPLARDYLVAMEHQQREQGTLAPPTDRHGGAVDAHFEWPEDVKAPADDHRVYACRESRRRVVGKPLLVPRWRCL